MTGRLLASLMLAACCAQALAADVAVTPTPAPAPAGQAAPSSAPAESVPPAAVTTTAAPAAAPITPRREPLVIPSAPSPSAGNLLQTIFGLVVVLALLGGLAWFLKRFGPKNASGSADLRIVGALNLGGRERIVVVEVGDQWIVVGASPGRVNALATIPRQHESVASSVPGAYAPSATSFSEWLKQTIDKRK